MKLSDLPAACRRHGGQQLIESGPGGEQAVSFAELIDAAEQLRTHLYERGLRPGHVVAIRGANSIGWVIWDLAILMLGAVVLSLAPDSEAGSVEECMRRHDLALFVTDDAALQDSAFVAPLQWQPGRAVPAFTVYDAARRLPDRDVAALVYSSGTSGRLKGLVMSRAGAEYFITRFIDSFALGEDNLHVLFLPLFSYQQRLTLYGCLAVGCSVVLAPYQRVFAALQRYRPTFLIGPPVLYDTALQVHAAQGGAAPLAAMFGGRLKFAITGMAPIAPRTITRYWEHGIALLQVYGMNECGMVCWNTPAHNRNGSVGRVVDEGEVELEPDGEIVVRRRAPLSLGYFDAAGEDASRTFRPDGAIATGDYGVRDADGYLTLLGRKKDIIVLRNGQKFHPHEVEERLLGVPGVAEAHVLADPLGARVTAVVVPEPGARSDTALAERVLACNAALQPHQRIGAVLLHGAPIASDPAYLTKNMKLDRGAVYRRVVEAARLAEEASV